MKNLKGKVVALTGAASGMGRCLAIQLSDLGCHLALVNVLSGLKNVYKCYDRRRQCKRIPNNEFSDDEEI